tara:strand:+ start:41 stop:352 length:312 start_codon:yes stop_codon:yes gene_type:complete
MSRYSKIKVINNPKDNNGARYYSTPFYPKVPLSENDIYVLTGEGDRLDLLAEQFYGDPNLWWVISSSNGDLPQNSLNLAVGTQLRIPSNTNKVINNFNKLNSK